MDLKRAGSQPSEAGPARYFTGTVRIDPLNAPPSPARHSCAAVTFEPGARSNWHTHPLGQTLIVTAGCGWTQCEGEDIVEIRAGNVIWCPPGHKHWHGATPTTAMTHIAATFAGSAGLSGLAVLLIGSGRRLLRPAGPARGVRRTNGNDALAWRSGPSQGRESPPRYYAAFAPSLPRARVASPWVQAADPVNAGGQSCKVGVDARWADQPRMKARISAFTSSAFVVCMPWGAPG